nr:uncharacterized protein LOC109619281 [Crassostrea gigas]
MKNLMKYVVISTVTSYMIMNTVAMTTNNRVLLSGVLVGSALAASYYGGYTFSPEELATLTTAVLVLNFPRKQRAEDSCTAPGYISDPVMGCYRLYKESKNSADAKQQCANDGGRLLIINSAAEFTKLVSLLNQESIVDLWVHGSRSSVSSPWLTDNGNPLPYICNGYKTSTRPTTLAFGMNADGTCGGLPIQAPISFICEILFA